MADGQQTKPPRGKYQAPGVSHRLRDSEPFFPESGALGERARLGMADGEPSPGVHGGENNSGEVLVTPHPLEERHGLPEAVDRPTVVASGLVGNAEDAVRPRLQDDVAQFSEFRQQIFTISSGLCVVPKAMLRSQNQGHMDKRPG